VGQTLQTRPEHLFALIRRAPLVNSRRSAISVASVYQVDDAPSISIVRNTSAGV
jgi:hypothetical protein